MPVRDVGENLPEAAGGERRRRVPRWCVPFGDLLRRRQRRMRRRVRRWRAVRSSVAKQEEEDEMEQKVS